MIAAKVVFISWHISSYFESDLFRFPVQQLKKAVVNLQRMFVMSYNMLDGRIRSYTFSLNWGELRSFRPKDYNRP